LTITAGTSALNAPILVGVFPLLGTGAKRGNTPTKIGALSAEVPAVIVKARGEKK